MSVMFWSYDLRLPLRGTFALALAMLVSRAPTAAAAVVGLWRFDEASGNAADSSGNGNTATPVGPNVSRAASQPGFGSAGSFLNDYNSGTPHRSYFQVPGNFSLQVGLTAGSPWSFTAWTNLNSDGLGLFFAQYPIVVTQKSAGSGNAGFLLQGGAAGDDQYYTGSDSNSALNVPTATANTLDAWTHLAVVYDGADYIFFKDGVEKKRTTVGSQSLNFFGYDGALQIGGGENRPFSRNWDGLLDDVAVFNQALTPAQLTTVKAGNFASFISPLAPPTSTQWQASGFGAWNTTLSWGPVIVPNSNSITAVFGGATTAPTTVVADQAQTVKGVEFNHTQPYAIAGAGSLIVGPASGNGSISVANAGGAVTHEFQLPVQLAANLDVSAAANTTLEFDHQLRLNGRTMNVGGAGRVNINSDSTSGTAGAVVNAGTLGGAGTILGSLTNSPGAKLAVDLSGTGAYGVQGLSVTGAATLGGTLFISLLNGFTPANGNTFDVLTATSMTNNGLVLGGASAGFSYSIVGGTTLRLTYGAGLQGDYNVDGRVDGADVLVWQRALGSNVATGTGADGSNNGLVDAADVALWNANFGLPATVTASAVPEPASGLVVLVALGSCAFTVRRPKLQRRQLAAVRTSRNRGSMCPLRAPSIAASARGWGIAAVLLAASALVPPAEATVLTFDFEATSNNFPTAPPASEYTHFTSSYTIVPEYGDRVSGPEQLEVPTAFFGNPPYWYKFYYGNNGEGYTPNVAVNYVHDSLNPGDVAFRSWREGFSGLDRVAYFSASYGAPGKFYMTFKGDAGVNVTLSSLKLAREDGSGDGDLTVRVHSGVTPASLGPQLYSSGSLFVAEGTPQSVTLGAGVTGNELTLVFDVTGGGTLFHFGVDDVVFSQSAGVQPTSVAWAKTGSGRWALPANWTPDYSPTLVPNGNDRTAVFGNATTGPATIVLDEDITVKKLQFNHNQPYFIAGTNRLTLQSNAGNAMIEVLSAGSPTTHQITAPIRLQSHADVSLASNTTLEVNNKLTLGSFNLAKTGAGTLRINNVVESTGGSLAALAGVVAGSGLIEGNLTNMGAKVAPGNSPGKLSVSGDFVQTSGVLEIELGGTVRGVDYDVLAIGGAAEIAGGALEIQLIDGFKPQAGDVFDILDFTMASGAFADVRLPSGVRWDASQLMVDGSITVLAVPEPGAAGLVAASLAAILGVARRRIR